MRLCLVILFAFTHELYSAIRMICSLEVNFSTKRERQSAFFFQAWVISSRKLYPWRSNVRCHNFCCKIEMFERMNSKTSNTVKHKDMFVLWEYSHNCADLLLHFLHSLACYGTSTAKDSRVHIFLRTRAHFDDLYSCVYILVSSCLASYILILSWLDIFVYVWLLRSILCEV